MDPITTYIHTLSDQKRQQHKIMYLNFTIEKNKNEIKKTTTAPKPKNRFAPVFVL